METTLNNIRMLRRVSGDGMSLAHMQDNLVSKLQDIYRTHDEAIHLLKEVELRNEVTDERAVHRAEVERSDDQRDHFKKRRSTSIRSVSPSYLKDNNKGAQRLDYPSGLPNEQPDRRDVSGEGYYDATHLPPAHGHNENYWQKKLYDM